MIVFRVIQWIVAIPIVIVILPIALSVCSGAFIVMSQTEGGDRSGRNGLFSLICVCFIPLGLYLEYLLWKLFF